MKNRKHIEILMNVHEDREELERLILTHTPRFQTLTEEAKTEFRLPVVWIITSFGIT